MIEEPDGDRILELNEGQAIHSLYKPGSFLTGRYWDGLIVLPFAGYYLGREIYEFNQQMGITMMGGFMSWLWIVQAFLIGVRQLTGNLAHTAAGPAYSTLAELLIDRLLERARDELRETHGDVPGGRVASPPGALVYAHAQGAAGGRHLRGTGQGVGTGLW